MKTRSKTSRTTTTGGGTTPNGTLLSVLTDTTSKRGRKRNAPADDARGQKRTAAPDTRPAHRRTSASNAKPDDDEEEVVSDAEEEGDHDAGEEEKDDANEQDASPEDYDFRTQQELGEKLSATYAPDIAPGQTEDQAVARARAAFIDVLVQHRLAEPKLHLPDIESVISDANRKTVVDKWRLLRLKYKLDAGAHEEFSTQRAEAEFRDEVLPEARRAFVAAFKARRKERTLKRIAELHIVQDALAGRGVTVRRIYEAANNDSLLGAAWRLGLTQLAYDPRETFRTRYDVPELRQDRQTHDKRGQRLDQLVKVAQLCYLLAMLDDVLGNRAPNTLLEVFCALVKTNADPIATSIRHDLGFKQKKDSDGKRAKEPVGEFTRMLVTLRREITAYQPPQQQQRRFSSHRSPAQARTEYLLGKFKSFVLSGKVPDYLLVVDEFREHIGTEVEDTVEKRHTASVASQEKTVLQRVRADAKKLSAFLGSLVSSDENEERLRAAANLLPHVTTRKLMDVLRETVDEAHSQQRTQERRVQREMFGEEEGAKEGTEDEDDN